MSQKLFSKNVRKSCSWCVYGKKSEYTAEVFCKKYGITTADDYCRKYKYDPLKRTPDTQKISKEFAPENFLI